MRKGLLWQPCRQLYDYFYYYSWDPAAISCLLNISKYLQLNTVTVKIWPRQYPPQHFWWPFSPHHAKWWRLTISIESTSVTSALRFKRSLEKFMFSRQCCGFKWSGFHPEMRTEWVCYDQHCTHSFKKGLLLQHVDSGLIFIPEAGAAGVNSSVKGLHLSICVAFPFH